MPESEVSDVDEERPVSPTESDPILEKKKKAVDSASLLIIRATKKVFLASFGRPVQAAS
jgi:hypothetical protein